MLTTQKQVLDFNPKQPFCPFPWQKPAIVHHVEDSMKDLVREINFPEKRSELRQNRREYQGGKPIYYPEDFLQLDIFGKHEDDSAKIAEIERQWKVIVEKYPFLANDSMKWGKDLSDAVVKVTVLAANLFSEYEKAEQAFKPLPHNGVSFSHATCTELNYALRKVRAIGNWFCGIGQGAWGWKLSKDVVGYITRVLNDVNPMITDRLMSFADKPYYEDIRPIEVIFSTMEKIIKKICTIRSIILTYLTLRKHHDPGFPIIGESLDELQYFTEMLVWILDEMHGPLLIWIMVNELQYATSWTQNIVEQKLFTAMKYPACICTVGRGATPRQRFGISAQIKSSLHCMSFHGAQAAYYEGLAASLRVALLREPHWWLGITGDFQRLVPKTDLTQQVQEPKPERPCKVVTTSNPVTVSAPKPQRIFSNPCPGWTHKTHSSEHSPVVHVCS
ncbi:hypothetical protein ABW19_dt0203952 [Dactylella cylindrospora]|nr:hypothetical protein ABW19_dt0203952 [Dactylella cylindrospora]